MRRTMGTIVGLSVILAMTGVAFASTTSAVTHTRASTITVRPANGSAMTIAQIGQLRQQAANGPEMVGTMVKTDRALDYVGADHVTLRYPGASYVKVHFAHLMMRPGDYVTVSNAKHTESYTYRTSSPSAEWGMSVTGDTAVVTLHHRAPAGLLDAMIAPSGVLVDEVARGFTPAERAKQQKSDDAARNEAIREVAAATDPGNREESVCGSDDSIDAVCYKATDPLAYKASKAVARILINGTELCTAWRVGTTDRLLTDHHCFSTLADLHNTEVWFNYECVVCGGYDTLATTKVWGDHLFATSTNLDFTLFSVHNFAQIKKFGYLTITTHAPKAGEEIYIPQHPEGDPTEIAMSSDDDQGGDCRVDDPTADGFIANSDVSYYCDTQGGSSGSPVLSRTSNRVIALHHFGGCPNSGVRIALVYAKIKKYLG
jgi:lysyl endopeptidase